MKSGVFHVPYTRPERSPRQVFDWSILMAQICDEAGFEDFMIGEHATQAWESVPNPEIVIGAAARETERIRFAPMAHLLAYHQPGSLAIQTGWLSQILEGRYFLGVGSGAYPRDAIIRGVPVDMSENEIRRNEALEIMRKVWDREAFSFEGTYYRGGYPEDVDPSDAASEYYVLPDYAPWQGPENLEIAMTSISRRSTSMRFAGEQGFSPILFYSGTDQVRGSWEVYAEGAASSGRTVDRSQMRVSRDVIIADTDAEAKKLALEGGVGRVWEKYLLHAYSAFGLLNGFVEDSGTGIDPADVDMNFVAEHVWICGSPETVTEKMDKMIADTGGFGTFVLNTHDYIDDPKPWIESLQRFGRDVAPNVSGTP